MWEVIFLIKKTVCALLLAISLFSLYSCSSSPPASTLILEFMSAYGISGTPITSDAAEFSEGYMNEESFLKIFPLDAPPRDYAILLNRRFTYGEECGFFVIRGEDKSAVLEMCQERIKLISNGKGGILLHSGDVIFYSTLSDSEKARDIFYTIIK